MSHETVLPAASSSRARAASAVRQVDAEFVEPACAAQREGAAVDVRFDAAACDRARGARLAGESLGRLRAAPSPFRGRRFIRLDHRPRQRMIAMTLHRCGKRQRLVATDAGRSARTSSRTAGRAVSVPVLSNATIVTRCAVSSASASLISTPCRAATPVPAMMAAGVARPSAHGHAITSTATAFRIAVSPPAPAISQPASVSAAIARIAGTKTSLTRSTRRWIGAFSACALSTSRMIRASVVSAPIAVVVDGNRAFAVDRAGGDRVGHLLRHRQAFAGDQRFVDMRAAFEHRAVDRHAFAGTHDHHRADAHLRERHVALVGADANARAVRDAAR